MLAPTVTKKKTKLEFTPAQATFNKNRRKIDKLRSQILTLKSDLDAALAQYHSKHLPLHRKTSEMITNYIFELFTLTTPPKALTKDQREVLDDLVKQDISIIFDLVPHAEVHDEIKKLHEEIHGISSSDAFHEQMSELKAMLKEKSGVEDIDFSELNPNDSLHEILQKIAMAAAEASHNNDKASSPPPRMKTKKQLLKEQKAQELETLQNKSLNTIYKQLAKEIHPDLEQDPKIRKEKEEVMKRLTTAYESNDLTTLLMLQSEWLDSEQVAEGKIDNETIKIYNSVLKDQIDVLQFDIDMLIMHPRYIEIFSMIQYEPLAPLKSMSQAFSETESLLEEYTEKLSDLKRPNALKILKADLEKIKDHFDFMDEMEEFLALDRFLSNIH